jgi:hypothetical protein
MGDEKMGTESIMIIEERLRILPSIKLERGAHGAFEKGACAMELASWLAGEKYNDHPECVCPVVAAFMRGWNDSLPDDERTALLLPLIPKTIGTRGSEKLSERRALMAADWLVRVNTPAWLRLAGLDTHADALSALPEITDMAQVPSIRGAIEAARADADAASDAASDDASDDARDAAWDAACAAARDAVSDDAWAAATRDATADATEAAWSAAWAAARDAASLAATVAAWSAASDAARGAVTLAATAAASDAARGAAWAALAPTRLALQQSAVRLVERMIEAREAQ